MNLLLFRKTFYAVVLFVFALTAQAQTGCPGCVVDLPQLPEDTIFLSDVAPGNKGTAFDEDMSFRLPKSTTPVAASDPGVPPGLNIDEITIISLSNLPPGLSWETSQTTFDVSSETDGCIKICGTPLTVGTYQVDVVIAAKISVITREASFSFELVIDPATSINDGFTMTNNIGCGIAEVNFNNNVISNGQPGYTYDWDFGNGATSSSENPGTQVYDQPGTYIVNYQAVIDTVGFILNSVHITEVDCDDLTSKPDIFVVITDPNGIEVYRSNEFRNTNPPITVSPNLKLESGNYKFEAIDADSGLEFGDDDCAITSFNQLSNGTLTGSGFTLIFDIFHPVDTIQTSDTVRIFANPAQPAIGFAYGQNIFCEGDSTILSSSYSEGNQWFKNGTAIPDATDSTFVVLETGLYQVEYTSAEGCTSFSNARIVNREMEPAAPVITVSTGQNIICEGDSVVLSSSYSTGNQWSLDGSPISGATNVDLTALAGGNYTVEYTSFSGCSNNSAAVLLEVSPLPAAPMVLQSTIENTFCEGESIVLTSSYTDNNQWFKDGLALGGETGEELEIFTTGTYSVTYTNTAGCSESSEEELFEVIPLPEAPFFINENNFLSLDNIVALPDSFILQWSINGVLLPSETDFDLCAILSGDYTLEVTDGETGCSNSFTMNVVVDPDFDCTVGIAELAASELQLQLFPNPTAGLMNVQLETEQETRIRISNVVGHLLMEQFYVPLGGEIKAEFNLNTLPSGIYLVTIDTGDQLLTRKIIRR